MTNLHARTLQSRSHAQLNRPYRFNPSPQTQATGNQIFPGRTWTFSTQPFTTAPRIAISPVMHPPVPTMPIPNVISSSGVAPISGPAPARTNPAAAKAPSIGSRLVSWLQHLGG